MKPIRLYWDSCAWLGLLNGEPDKKRELEIIYGNARQGRFQLWTSTLSMVEVRRLKAEEHATKPLSEQHAKTIQDLFMQPFVMPIPLDVDIATRSRDLFRTTPGLGKFQDAIHLTSALRWNASVLHTYDREDLLHLSGQFECRNAEKLTICYPNDTTDGPLFARLAQYGRIGDQ